MDVGKNMSEGTERGWGGGEEGGLFGYVKRIQVNRLPRKILNGEQEEDPEKYGLMESDWLNVD
jgi:hypothetical protein